MEADHLSNVLDSADTYAAIVCKHDLSLMEENSYGLSTLLSPQEILMGDSFNQSFVDIENQNLSTLFGLQKVSV